MSATEFIGRLVGGMRTQPVFSQHDDDPKRSINIAGWERLGTAAVGSLFLLQGLTRGTVGGKIRAILGGALIYRAATGHCPMYAKLGELAVRPTATEAVGKRTLTIGKAAKELFHLWNDPAVEQAVMSPFAEINSNGDGQRHWSAVGPTGKQLTWESHVVEQRPGEFSRWESVQGAAIPNSGEIRFAPAPGGRGTEVTLSVRYHPPGGKLGLTTASLFGYGPKTIVDTTLRRFKSIAETGEAATLRSQPAARDGGRDELP